MIAIEKVINTYLFVVEQMLYQHVVLEILISRSVPGIRFPSLHACLVIQRGIAGHVLAVTLFFPGRHGQIFPVSEPSSDLQVCRLVSDYPAQASAIIRGSAAEH